MKYFKQAEQDQSTENCWNSKLMSFWCPELDCSAPTWRPGALQSSCTFMHVVPHVPYLQQPEPLLVVEPLHCSPEPADHYVVVMITWGEARRRMLMLMLMSWTETNHNKGPPQVSASTPSLSPNPVWSWMVPVVQRLMASDPSQSICLLNELHAESRLNVSCAF